MTITLCPAAATAGTVRADTFMSGPMRIKRVLVLLPSKVSGTARAASAFAMMYQLPVGVSARSTTLVVPELLAPGERAATSRLPSGTSAASRMVLAERKYCICDAAAAPPPWFSVVSVMAMVSPAPALVGADRLGMFRSAPIWIERPATLFASCSSGTTPVASARAMRCQVAAAVP